MTDKADGNYSPNPWMKPEKRPGDDVAPVYSVLDGEAMAAWMVETNRPPYAAGVTPRLLGIERTQPTITDVLSIGPNTLMRDTPTNQDSGMQGTSRPAFGGI